MFNNQWRSIERDLIMYAIAMLLDSVDVIVGELCLPDALGFLVCGVMAGWDITLFSGGGISVDSDASRCFKPLFVSYWVKITLCRCCVYGGGGAFGRD